MEFTWEGRQLKTAAANGKNISYAYNSDGIRTSKTVDGVTTSYLLDGSTLIAQKTGDDVLWFLYDSDGTRVGFTYNGAAYYYTTNTQGDVTGIVDKSVNSVVEYSYDAWGKLLTTTGSMADTVGKINPFLYRGYYYDVVALVSGISQIVANKVTGKSGIMQMPTPKATFFAFEVKAIFFIMNCSSNPVKPLLVMFVNTT